MSLLTISECVAATGGTLQNYDESNSSVNAVITDSRVDCSGGMFVALRGEHFDGHDFVEDVCRIGAVVACVDADYSTDAQIPLLVVEDTVKAYQDLARFYRQKLGLTVIAVTGTSGKTSTKEILLSVCREKWGESAVYATKANTNNHIGVPQNIFNLTTDHEVAILEMGTNHPGEIATLTSIGLPDIAVVTSISAGHVEHLGSVEDVAHEKASIFSALKPNGIAVYPATTDYTDILEKASSHVQTCVVGRDIGGMYTGGNLEGSSFSYHIGEKLYDVDWSIHGRHQCDNALLAVAVGVSLGIEGHSILHGLENASLTGMRMRISECDDVMWVNDAYNANPDSTKAGLDWLSECTDDSRKRYVVLGDMLELGKAGPDYHKEILVHAGRVLPDASFVLVGDLMIKASEDSDAVCFKSSSAAAEYLAQKLKENSKKSIVYLKGSRGVKLEVIEKECCK